MASELEVMLSESLADLSISRSQDQLYWRIQHHFEASSTEPSDVPFNRQTTLERSCSTSTEQTLFYGPRISPVHAASPPIRTDGSGARFPQRLLSHRRHGVMSPAFLPSPTPLPRRTSRRRHGTTPCMRAPSNPFSPLLPATAAAVVLLAGTLPSSPLSPLLPPRVHAAQPGTAFAAAATVLTADRVLDYGRILTSGEVANLSSRLSALEEATGPRVLVVTKGVGASASGANIRWPTPAPGTVVIAVDADAGNSLSFSVGQGVYSMLPASFWLEASNRFGNAFYVRENGLDAALFSVVKAIEDCARPGRLCRAVPGVSDDQWKISVVCAGMAGSVVGAAARTGGKKFNANFVLLFSPLWSIFLVSFGVGPIVSRGPGVEMQLASTAAAFVVLAAAVWWWIPVRFGPPGQDGSTDV